MRGADCSQSLTMKSDKGEEDTGVDHDPNGREETIPPTTEYIAWAGGFLRGSPALSPTVEVDDEDDVVATEQDGVEQREDSQGVSTGNPRHTMGPKGGPDELLKERQP